MRRSLRFLLPLALAAFVWGCEGAENVVLIDVFSQREISSLDMVVISRDGLGEPFQVSEIPIAPSRTPEDLELTPIRVAVEVPAPTTIIVHLWARTPAGELLIATRCYGVNGIITDQVVLAGPLDALDADGDTFITDTAVACREPTVGGGDRACMETDLHVCDSMADADCNDGDASIFPGAPTVCQDGIDQDCDGADEACQDNDGDGVDACPPCVCEPGCVCEGEPDCDCCDCVTGCDCNDNDASINPRAEDICQDGIDQDCDGADACCDVDGDGFPQCRDDDGLVTGDCVDSIADCPTEMPDCDPAAINPGAAEECDGIDNNCNMLEDELDECRAADLDGDGVAACGREEPGQPCEDRSYDCDAAIFPGARERCGNGIDEDLDGMIDEASACPAGDMDNDGQIAPLDCDDSDPLAFSHRDERPDIDRCDDGVAQSCVPGDDRSCSDDRDGDGFVEPDRCEDNASINPDAPEMCNGIDDNCDGTTDEVLDPTRTRGCAEALPITFATDFGHCGACRNFCNPVLSDQCEGGMCVCTDRSVDPPTTEPACTGGDPMCCPGIGCKDLDNDRDNCGGCGIVCGQGESCSGGICRCGTASGAGLGLQACVEPAGVTGTEANICCGTQCRDVRSDVNNCGGCGTVCGSQSVVCDDRICRCDPGNPTRNDCNADLGMGGNGCETETQTSLDHCGSCGRRCRPANATGVCTTGSCRIASCNSNWDDCNRLAGDGCEGNLRSLTHCGSCGSGCSISNASETCGTGSCRVASCNSGWDDCNSDGTSCETRLNQLSDCGSCGTTCNIANASETCTTGSCRVTSCNSGWDDCNSDGTSCETRLNTLGDCGSCSTTCSISNASETCSTGMCRIMSCSSGWDDCNSDMTSCETRLNTLGDCGSCGTTCSISNASETCSTGMCRVTSCNSGWGDCNSDMTSCETRLNMLSDCGSCGTTCSISNATETCSTGSCRVMSCDSGWDDCDSDMTSCETRLNMLSDCGSCGTTCSIPNASETCSTGSCRVMSCDTDWDDCDSDMTSCETDLRTLGDCGSCGTTCSIMNATETCATGMCRVASCDADWGDCDGDPTDCEANLNTSESHCGACGVTCASGANCNSGTCQCPGGGGEDCNTDQGDACTGTNCRCDGGPFCVLPDTCGGSGCG